MLFVPLKTGSADIRCLPGQAPPLSPSRPWLQARKSAYMGLINNISHSHAMNVKNSQCCNFSRPRHHPAQGHHPWDYLQVYWCPFTKENANALVKGIQLSTRRPIMITWGSFAANIISKSANVSSDWLRGRVCHMICHMICHFVVCTAEVCVVLELAISL